MLPQPITEKLRSAKRVLIAGAGGGYDVVCGLPLFFSVEALGGEVHLANLTFTDLNAVSGGSWLSDGLLQVDANCSGPAYFPEGWLARWFRDRLHREVPVWCFKAAGALPYTASYRILVERLQIDTVLVVDGGVDTLLRGDEFSLGTPLWDALTIAAVHSLDVPHKILVSIGFGAERWDKISHSQVLERIADLTREDALLGVTTLLQNIPEGRLLKDAVYYLFRHQPDIRQSTVASSLLAALEGRFGERPVNAYTEQTPVWVSPLMCLYWFFDLVEVARQKLYLSRLLDTETLAESADRLKEFRASQPARAAETIPI